jgi:hypothetical protein
MLTNFTRSGTTGGARVDWPAGGVNHHNILVMFAIAVANSTGAQTLGRESSNASFGNERHNDQMQSEHIDLKLLLPCMLSFNPASMQPG